MIRLLTLTLLLCMGLGCRAREEVDALQSTETEPAVVDRTDEERVTLMMPYA